MPGPTADDAPGRAAVSIIQTLRDAGAVAYLAGGCVRDTLLGLTPKDYDVATDATPDRVAALFRSTSLVGKAFGVVIVRLGKPEGFAATVQTEVATFRKDAAYSDARRPDAVEFTDARTDAERRDITINAIFLDPTGAEGRTVNGVPGVIDFVGGADDLRAGLVRAVGDPAARLREDHLRALRCVRFAARLGFTLDPATAEAIRHDAVELKGVSVERIGEEVRAILRHPSRARGAALLADLGLTTTILGRPASGATFEPLPALDALPPDTPLAAALVAFGLASGIAPAELPRTLRRTLDLSNADTDDVRHALASLRFLLSAWEDASVSGRKRAAAGPGFGDARHLLEAADPSRASSVGSDLERLEATPSGIAPAPLVSGDDLIRLGATPGPVFRSVLDQTYDAQLEDRLASHAEALGFARDLLDERPNTD